MSEHLDAGLASFERVWGPKAAEQALHDITNLPNPVTPGIVEWARKRLEERAPKRSAIIDAHKTIKWWWECFRCWAEAPR